MQKISAKIPAPLKRRAVRWRSARRGYFQQNEVLFCLFQGLNSERNGELFSEKG
jgi:hypothetical protein